MEAKKHILLPFTILLFVTYSQQASLLPNVDNCQPGAREDAVQYIVGYGSLINSDSKRRTSPDTGINIPVSIKGFKRTWTARGYSNTTLSTTYLGVDIDQDASFNGVIFSLTNASALHKYDERERFYCRVRVPWEDVTVLRGRISDNGTFPTENELKDSEIWIYVTIPKYSEYPDERYPIVQSYVDIFLGGCIQMERKYGLNNYAEECVTKTIGWDYPWVNDRVHPRRPWQYQSEAGSIDRLVYKLIPDLASRVYVEKIYVGQKDRSGGTQTAASLCPLVATTALITMFQVIN